MADRPLIITLPLPETLTNSGAGRSRHYRVVARRKKQYYAYLDELQLIKRIPAPPAAAIGAARLAIVMHVGGRMDHDNAAARCKWPLDWLATRGYVRNDRLLEWAGLPEQVVKRDGDYRLVFTITPIAEHT